MKCFKNSRKSTHILLYLGKVFEKFAIIILEWERCLIIGIVSIIAKINNDTLLLYNFFEIIGRLYKPYSIFLHRKTVKYILNLTEIKNLYKIFVKKNN